jgi:peptidoglycan/xylan/chitin deacetylase (PgdA/CDA1 family)
VIGRLRLEEDTALRQFSIDMLKQIKRAVLGLSKGAGLFSVVGRSGWRSRRLLILCYHGVSLEDEHNWNPELFIPPKLLEGRLQMLQDGGCSILPLGDAVQMLYSGNLPDRSVSITFDDGMYNFYARAFPILSKFRFPATVYLTTYYCENNLPVFPLVCSYILWKSRGMRLEAEHLPGVQKTVDLRNVTARNDVVEGIRRYADDEKLSAVERNEFTSNLAALLKFDFHTLCSKRLFHIMTKDEVSTLSAEGIDFQLHTHRHRSPLDKELFEREIRDNRDRIVKFARISPTHFCYPSGVTHPKFLQWLSEENVVSATTCSPNLASREATRLLLPRIVDTCGLTQTEFESWLTGFGCLLPRRRGYVEPTE